MAVIKTENLLTLGFITETNVQYYQKGEVSGVFNKDQLKEYIKKYGTQGLIKHLSWLNFQIVEVERELDYEATKDGARPVA